MVNGLAFSGSVSAVVEGVVRRRDGSSCHKGRGIVIGGINGRKS